ncbi:MAG: four helix bundle protein [Lewinellaceae bacterium]|nr:four helix bundle protein [Lewinellaceae bacterium]
MNYISNYFQPDFVGEGRSSYYWQGFEDLDVWQQAHAFVKIIYTETTAFPTEEKFGLIQQFRRAAVSIPANIAEGMAKRSSNEQIRFLLIARGSLAECHYFIILARDIGYWDQDLCVSLIERVHQIRRMLNGLIRAIEIRNGKQK